MIQHFEELWEKSETFQKEACSDIDVQDLIEELILKISLYKAMGAKEGIPEEDLQKIKLRTLGEILLTLTGISLKDNINVFEALNIALQYRSIDYYNRKHPV